MTLSINSEPKKCSAERGGELKVWHKFGDLADQSIAISIAVATKFFDDLIFGQIFDQPLHNVAEFSFGQSHNLAVAETGGTLEVHCSKLSEGIADELLNEVFLAGIPDDIATSRNLFTYFYCLCHIQFFLFGFCWFIYLFFQTKFPRNSNRLLGK